ncbi:hypothetical protein E1262_02710 [Jiangella aurantiaca]|uniref:Uncharacterized protein n=1 Tax=Jiangella aurantiaca TaxID=2530373 RepID=A0A4R5AKT6_9ACTN|nr:hypothetical protein [Jiangella aurantiaca]TDD72250.1 hypothetical protein E1262_02710 [Jiangella aurantiaca]
MTADLEFGTTGDHGTAWRPGPPVRSPAMRAYCATLARFTSSVQSTEQLLRNDDAGTREDTEQRELAAATRLRGIDRAGAAADDGLAQCAAVRAEYGLPAGSALHAVRRPSDDVTVAPPSGPPAGAGRLDDSAPPLDRLRRTGGADLGIALTALGRRRDELKLAETEFAHWLEADDERSRRVTLGALAAAGLGAAAVMAVAGTRTSAGTALALLIVCALTVVAVGLGVAAARRLPRVCRGAGLARRPDGRALVKYGARIGGVALLALTAANLTAGAL